VAFEVVRSVDSEIAQRNRNHRLAKYNHHGFGLSSPSATHYNRLDYFFWLHILAPLPVVARSYCSG
jgi:hypothetical protein